jgi:hypothetical protein
MSNYTSRPAEELCNSATSWGLDFVGSDDQFCDTSSKTLSPLCSSQVVVGCIETDENEGNLVKRPNTARCATSIVYKSYKKLSK